MHCKFLQSGSRPRYLFILLFIKMFIDYRSHVLLKYRRERDAQSLSPLLIQPTPGNLRTECLNLCKERFDKKDQEILRTFFGPYDNFKDYIKAIAEFDVSKFKPLLNFITEKTVDTELKNIELLAWLVDFQPRPFQRGYHYENIFPAIEPVSSEKKIDGIVAKPKVEAENREGAVEPFDVTDSHGTGKKIVINRYILIAGFLLCIITVTAFWLWAHINLQEGGCMYWTGDHYDAVACNQPVNSALVIAADSIQLKSFKRLQDRTQLL